MDYYLGLISSQYQNSPKFLAWLMANLQILIDIGSYGENMASVFDINAQTGGGALLLGPGLGDLVDESGGKILIGLVYVCAGDQLDVIGSIVGQSRTVGFQPSKGVSPVLDDDTYRLLIKAKIAFNQWDGKIASLQTIWQSLFPTGKITVTDNQDMTMTVSVSGVTNSIINDLVMNGYIVPRPEGVYCNPQTVKNMFGFGAKTEWIGGFGQGIWQ
jgi:hypothetical protein